MRDVIRYTYILLSSINFDLSNIKLWAIEDSYAVYGNKFNFLSVDGKKYSLVLQKDRPHNRLAIPYELFIEDEICLENMKKPIVY